LPKSKQGQLLHTSNPPLSPVPIEYGMGRTSATTNPRSTTMLSPSRCRPIPRRRLFSNRGRASVVLDSRGRSSLRPQGATRALLGHLSEKWKL
jgi:hypothetical protein